MLFRAGACVYGPVTGDIGTINKALQMMDLEIEEHDFDEFDAVGLGAYRSNEDWLKNKGIRTP